MGCPAAGCDGYELIANLDFDTNASGDADAGDEYWNEGKGWLPIWGGKPIRGFYAHLAFLKGAPNIDHRRQHVRMFTGVFEGNARTIANLYIYDDQLYYTGLFAYIGPGGEVRNLGLIAPNPDSKVLGSRNVGALVGLVQDGRVSGCYSELDVKGVVSVGGLMGGVFGKVSESYATGDVSGDSFIGGLAGVSNGAGIRASYATGNVRVDDNNGGGLVGYRTYGNIISNYATGSVTRTGSKAGNGSIGALVGGYPHGYGTVKAIANYATGAVSAPPGSWNVGGLTGWAWWYRDPSAGNNYWDVDTTGQPYTPSVVDKRGYYLTFGTGYTTAELQTPTGYTGIYANWNLDVDGDGTADDPWDFGTDKQYPVLKYCADKPGIDTADGQPYCPLQPANQR